MANYATSALKLSDTYVNTLPYNTCSTAAGTAAKTVDAGTFSLERGAMVVVKFTTTNTAANPTLNVSSTGAKAIYHNGTAITPGCLKENKVYQFTYNGTQWDLVGDVDNSYVVKESEGKDKYFKICTINLPNSYSDLNFEFTLIARSLRSEHVKVFTQKSNTTALSNARILCSGDQGDCFNVHGYKYIDSTNGDYLEIWCTLFSWDSMTVHEDNLGMNVGPSALTWNNTISTTLPTTSSTIVKINASLENWAGNAATATTLKNLTASVTELNYVDGVTSNIQTQLDKTIKTSANQQTISSTTTDTPLKMKSSDDKISCIGYEGKNSGIFGYIGVNSSKQPIFYDTTSRVMYHSGNYTSIPTATSSAKGLVKSGGDITVASDGIVSVNDDSHNHVISNVDGLQTALDSKLPKAGGTFTGAVSSSADKANGTAQFRNSIVASSVPSDLSSLKVGDIIYVEGESSGGSSADLSGYATKTYADTGDTGVKTWVGQQGYATQSWVNNKGYTTADEVREIVSGYYPCLVEGTPIDMADGTQKVIEDIQPGDLIKSYNPITKEVIEAVAISAYTTGSNRNYMAYNFTDGRSLVVFEQHQIYDAVEGTTFDIRTINRNHRIVNIDNEQVQWAGKRVVVYHGRRRKRYNLISSNNLYFANGILLGNKPFDKLEYLHDFNKPMSAEVVKIWKQDCEDYNAVTATPADASAYLELKDVYKEYAEAQNQIAVNKRRLDDSDYKSIKRSENLIGDEEWEVISKDRQKWRDTINENEVKYNELRAKIDAAWAARRPENWTGRSLFEGCFTRDNDAFALVKAYYENQATK